ncbi:TolC family protein [Altererythrobacter sp. Root672]|uniref:TolC family protein n=1 Tax=Altererythrobacter sp. Root672 TaxID=1736584 RepID=UPI0006F8F823|nr:TolC family protein [Altererythrobacter sp. Root672]KRA81230.1 metal transporter [Altererythrobacter sp. Root672]
MKSVTLWGALLVGAGFAAVPLSAAAQDTVTLEEALDLAGATSVASAGSQNPRAIGPRAEVEAAQALVTQAGLGPNPEASLEVENVAGSGLYSGTSAAEYTFSAGLPLELGGKRGARLAVARADVDVARLREQVALADLAMTVRQRYVGAVAAQSRVTLALDVVERNRELARIATELVDAGREPPLRSLRAQSELAEAEAELKAAQATALASRFALGMLWSQDPAPPPADGFPRIEPPYELLAEYQGLEPRLAAAERIAAQSVIGRERTLGIPDPTVSAGVRRFEESNDNALVLGLSIPLPFRDRNQGNVAAAQAQARAAAARETVAVSEYRQAVAEARADYLAAEAKADTLEAGSLPQAEEAVRLADIGYRNGKFEMLELLSAAEARDGIRRALIDAREAQGKAAALLIRLAAQ